MTSLYEGSVPATLLAKLALDLEDAFEENSRSPLTHDLLVKVASARGTTVSRCYAASLLAPDVTLADEHPSKVVFCAGECQRRGSLECVDRAAEVLVGRLAARAPGFDIGVKSCLNRCEHGVVCEVHTAGGTAVEINTTPATIEALLPMI